MRTTIQILKAGNVVLNALDYSKMKNRNLTWINFAICGIMDKKNDQGSIADKKVLSETGNG